MLDEETEAKLADFKRCAQAYISGGGISPRMWQHWRSLCTDSSDTDAGKPNPLATVDEVLEEGAMVFFTPIEELFLPPFREDSIVVGSVAGEPVHYVYSSGIFFCRCQEKRTFSLWLTTPAYPPGW